MSDADTPSGMDALGHPVPFMRRSNGLRHLREMAPDWATEDHYRLIEAVCCAIERDDPYEALAVAGGHAFTVHHSSPDAGRSHEPLNPACTLDVTGCYRLLAALCVNAPIEANYTIDESETVEIFLDVEPGDHVQITVGVRA